jgi:predicted MFS family arabinose efflux permease
MLILGVAVTLVAVATGSAAGLYVGTFIAGLGFGPSFSGVFRSLTPLAPPDRRAALVASIYVVCYTAFSVPAILAGIAITHYTLADATYVYGAAVIVFATLTTLAVSRRSVYAAAS